MILLVDIGNSAMHWAQKGPTGPGPVQHLYYRDRPLPGDAWQALARPEQVLIGSVASAAVTAGVTDWCRDTWQIAPQLVSAQAAALGVTSGYDNPQQLGVDRWLALIGAHTLGLAPCCIADCGTAITIDVLDGQGQHAGGLILPGLDMMQCALVDNTEGIAVPESVQTSAGTLGKDTAAGIYKGSLLAVTSSIEHIARLAAGQSGDSMQVIVTGGDAARVAEQLAGQARVVPDLVLQGLSALADCAA